MNSNEYLVQLLVASISALGAVAIAFITKPRSLTHQIAMETLTMLKRISILRKNNLFIFFISPLLGSVLALTGYNTLANAKTITAPFDVAHYFFPSGWMGDYEDIEFNDQWKDNCHTVPTCIRVTYIPGEKGWAAVYWQYPDKNWGEKSGRIIEGAKKLSLWARSKAGGELVTFKAGGIANDGMQYHDSFEKAISPVELGTAWQRYEIDLAGEDLGSVLGAFVWVASRSGNPNGLTFYLDDVRYE